MASVDGLTVVINFDLGSAFSACRKKTLIAPKSPSPAGLGVSASRHRSAIAPGKTTTLIHLVHLDTR
jgi:hypothetical protein